MSKYGAKGYYFPVDPAMQEHVKHLEGMIDAQRETQHELEVELEKKDRLIKENEYSYKRQKMKHIEEMRNQNKELEKLRADLEAAANSNAYLQNELLKHKKGQYLANQASAGQTGADLAHAPVPPKESRTNPKRAYHIRRTLAEPTAVKEDLKNLQPVRPASGSGVRGGSGGTSRSDSPAELLKPFLPQDDVEQSIQIKHSEPLPPIRTSSGRVMFQDKVDVVHVSVHNVPKPILKSKGVRGSSQEVETLAVGQLPHSDTGWRRHGRKESHSTDYR